MLQADTQQLDPQILASLLAGGGGDQGGEGGNFGLPQDTMNPLAAALSNGMPGVVSSPGSSGVVPAPSAPPPQTAAPAQPPPAQSWRDMLASALGGGAPSTNSRYGPDGNFLPTPSGGWPGAGSAQPQPAVANAAPLPSPVQTASAATSDTDTAAPGEDATTAAYRQFHDQLVAHYDQAMALAKQATAAGRDPSAYLKVAQDAVAEADKVNLAAIEYGKPVAAPQTVKPGDYVLQPDGSYKPIGPATHAYSSIKLSDGREVPFDPSTGTYGTPYGTPGGSSAALMGADGKPVDENLSGPDVLKAVPPPVATMAQRMIDGLQPVPALTVRTSPVVTQATLAAQAVDPTLDANESKQRMGTQKDFTSGPTSKVITAGNTALGHLTDLATLVPQLQNSDLPYGATILNSGVNAAKGTGSAGAPLARFNELNQLYSAEMEKFYAGSSGGTAGERKQLELNISPNMTPTQQMAAIQTAARALASKVEALNGQWHSGMGPMAADFQVIHPENRAFVENMRSGPLGTLMQGGQAAPSAPQGAPPGPPPPGKAWKWVP